MAKNDILNAGGKYLRLTLCPICWAESQSRGIP